MTIGKTKQKQRSEPPKISPSGLVNVKKWHTYRSVMMDSHITTDSEAKIMCEILEDGISVKSCISDVTSICSRLVRTISVIIAN